MVVLATEVVQRCSAVSLSDRKGDAVPGLSFTVDSATVTPPTESRRYLVTGHFGRSVCPGEVASDSGSAYPAGDTLRCEEQFFITRLGPPTG